LKIAQVNFSVFANFVQLFCSSKKMGSKVGSSWSSWGASWRNELHNFCRCSTAFITTKNKVCLQSVVMKWPKRRYNS